MRKAKELKELAADCKCFKFKQQETGRKGVRLQYSMADKAMEQEFAKLMHHLR